MCYNPLRGLPLPLPPLREALAGRIAENTVKHDTLSQICIKTPTQRGVSSKSSNSHRMLPLGFLRVNGQTCAQNRWLEHPEYQFPRLFKCKWCSTGQARAARVRTLYSKLQAGVPRVQILCKTANPDAYFDEISTRVRTFGVPRPKTANPDAYFGEISNRVRTFGSSRPILRRLSAKNYGPCFLF